MAIFLPKKTKKKRERTGSHVTTYKSFLKTSSGANRASSQVRKVLVGRVSTLSSPDTRTHHSSNTGQHGFTAHARVAAHAPEVPQAHTFPNIQALFFLFSPKRTLRSTKNKQTKKKPTKETWSWIFFFNSMWIFVHPRCWTKPRPAEQRRAQTELFPFPECKACVHSSWVSRFQDGWYWFGSLPEEAQQGDSGEVKLWEKLTGKNA